MTTRTRKSSALRPSIEDSSDDDDEKIEDDISDAMDSVPISHLMATAAKSSRMTRQTTSKKKLKLSDAVLNRKLPADRIAMDVEGNESDLTSVNTENKTEASTPTRRKAKPWYFELKYISRNMDMEGGSLVLGGWTCRLCGSNFSSKTSSGSIIKHLRNVHGKEPPTLDPGTNTMRMSAASRQMKLTSQHVSKREEDMLDTTMTVYVAEAALPHTHVKSNAMTRLIGSLKPGYSLKSPKTTKRRILELYVLLKYKIREVVAAIPGRFSLTFDGWTNPSYRGYCSSTIHFIDSHGVLRDALLGYFYVPPGKGLGQRTGVRLYEFLCSVGCSQKLLATVTDNGSDAIVAARTLADLLEGRHGRVIVTEDNQRRCLVHTMQLGVKEAVAVAADSTATIRDLLVTLRSSKNSRATYREWAEKLSRKQREVPSIDCETRWNSTFIMLSLAVRERDVIVAVMKDTRMKKSMKNTPVPTDMDWENAKALLVYLEVPATISTQLEGHKYVTVSSAICATNALADHNEHCMTTYSSESFIYKAAAACAAKLAGHGKKIFANPTLHLCQILDTRIPSVSSQIKDNTKQTIVDIIANDYSVAKDASDGVDVDDQVREYALDPFGGIPLFNTKKSPPAALPVMDQASPREVISSEIDALIRTKTVPPQIDIFDWHTKNATLYVKYAARDYLATPASSAPAERENSKAGSVWKGRYRMGDEVFHAEMCVRSWIPLIESVGIELPVDIKKEYRSLPNPNKHVGLEEDNITDSVTEYLYRLETRHYGEASEESDEEDNEDW